jgi:hypothetical protein
MTKLQKLIKETGVKPLTKDEHKSLRLNAYKPAR